MEALPGLKVNGELTLGENIGDLTGLVIAHRAYQMSLSGKAAPVMDGLTGDQRFFAGWAQAWRAKIRDDALRQQVLTDPHSPDMVRGNGPLPNVPAFYAAFDVKAGRQAVPAARPARQDLVSRSTQRLRGASAARGLPEGVARLERALRQAAAQPLDALLRRAVGPRFGRHATLRRGAA